jgi:hypothetical protein
VNPSGIKKYRGFYTVGGLMFLSKSAAYYYSLQTQQPITWYFHNHIWDKFYSTKKDNLGHANLDLLYKKRAQQLRDSYDYLILHYSGGADSHNVLQTFISAGIHIDEVFVRRHDRVESKLYTPDPTNTSPENILSEYDFAQLPTLRYLAINHPKIKLTTCEVFDENPEKLINDDAFLTMPHTMSLMDNFRQGARSPNEKRLKDKGLKIANIFGNDKPIVYTKGNDCYMTFTDSGLSAGLGLENVEAFYWTADMPELPFEQAFAVFEHFKKDKTNRWTIDINEFGSLQRQSSDLRENIMKSVLYKTTWDFKTFQTSKGLLPYKGPYIIPARDVLYLENPFFQKLHERWLYHYQNWNVKNLSLPTLGWHHNKRYLLGSFD